MGDDPNDLGVLLDALKLGVDLLRSLGELLCVPGEGLLLRLVPVLVEPVRRGFVTTHKSRDTIEGSVNDRPATECSQWLRR